MLILFGDVHLPLFRAYPLAKTGRGPWSGTRRLAQLNAALGRLGQRPPPAAQRLALEAQGEVVVVVVVVVVEVGGEYCPGFMVVGGKRVTFVFAVV